MAHKKRDRLRPQAWPESGPVTAYVGMEVQRLFREGWFSGIVTDVDLVSK
jgi:hypothetical protein